MGGVEPVMVRFTIVSAICKGLRVLGFPMTSLQSYVFYITLCVVERKAVKVRV